MKQFLFYSLCMLLSAAAFSQNSYDIDSRKGKLFLGVGTEYRITPIYQANAGNSIVNIDRQNSGIALNFGLDYFVTRNLSLGFSNSLRYDAITDGRSMQPGGSVTSSVDNGLIYDIHLYADYHFQVFKESELLVRLGASLMNRGTEFTQTSQFTDSNGMMGTRTLSGDFAYEALNLGIGWKKDKISVMAGAYVSGTTDFNVDNTFVVPYLSFKYNLGKL